MTLRHAPGENASEPADVSTLAPRPDCPPEPRPCPRAVSASTDLICRASVEA